MISCTLHPASASLRHVALRSPCGESPSGNSRQVAEAVEQYVTDAATKSAKAELGQEGFDRLAQFAAMSPTIDQALRQYASLRALGKTSDSWSDLLEMAAEELGH